MTGKILKSMSAFVCFCLLITELFTNTYIEAKPFETNYVIDVQETGKGTFILTRNISEVPDDITLLSLTDEEENKYDPMQFQMEVSDEKTYYFDLEYKTANEEIKNETIYVEVMATKEESDTNEGEEQSTDSTAEEEWTLTQNSVYQLNTEYSEDHSYMEVTLENISDKDVYDIAFITDNNGNDHTFDTSWRLNEEGTYTYEIKYYDNETGYKTKETHQVVVDDIQQPKTMDITLLQEKVADTSAKINMYAYQYGSGIQINNNQALTIPNGTINDNLTSFELNGYSFHGVYVKKGGANGVLYKVAFIYSDGTDIYYTVEDNNNTQPTLAYRLSQDEEIGAYYLKVGVTSIYTLKSGITASDVTYKITAMDEDNDSTNGYQVYEGTSVAIRVDYANNYASVDLLINGSTQNYVKKDEHLVDNYVIFTFEMPSTDVTFTLNKKAYTSDKGLLALVNGDNKTFNTTEVGLSAFGSFNWMGATQSLDGSDIVYAVDRGQWSAENSKALPPGSTTVDPFSNVLTKIYGDSNQNDYISGGVYGGKNINVQDQGTQQVNKHAGTDSNGSTINSPIASFTRGQTLTFEYLVKRVNVGLETKTSTLSPWGLYETYYDYRFNNLYIEYFPDQLDNVLNTNDFTNKDGNTVIRENIKVPAFGVKNTVTTTLRSGAKVTVTVMDSADANLNSQNLIDTSLDSNIKSTAQWQKIKIEITGLYDDFRLTASSSSGAHKYLTFQNVEGIANTNNADDAVDTLSYVPVAGNKSKYIETGLTLVAANDSPTGDGIFEFVLNPLDGYSVPALTKYSYTGTVENIIYGTAVENIEIVTDKFPDENGYYHYRYRRNQASTADRIKYFDITANPINFIVDYSDLTNKPSYVTDQTKYDVLNNTYFSVSNEIPSNGTKYFTGWGIKIIDQGESNTEQNDNRYLKDENGELIIVTPGDLISISYLYDRMQDNNFMQQSDIGKSDYKIQFVAQWSNTIQDGSYKTDGEIHIFNQANGVTSFDNSSMPSSGYSIPSTDNNTLIENQNYIVGANIALGNYSETKDINGSKYMLNKSKSMLSTRTTSDVLIGYLTYDKVINVNYDLAGGVGNQPTDTNEYTTVSGHNSVITLSKGEPTKTNEDFIGWKIVSGNYSSNLYKYNSTSTTDITIDLSTLSKDLLNSIFSNGTVRFVAQYQSSVGAIKHVDNEHSLGNKINTEQWLSDDEISLTISQSFYYDGDANTFANAKTNGSIYIALYKQEGGTGNFILLNTNINAINGINNGTGSISDVDSNKNFTVTYTVTEDNSVKFHKDNYRIVCWTTANGASSFTDTTLPSSSKSDESYSKVPYGTRQYYVISPITNSEGNLGYLEETATKWLYERSDTITIKQQFKYNGDSSTFEDAKSKNKLHVALYRQDSLNSGQTLNNDNATYTLLDTDVLSTPNDTNISYDIGEINKDNLYTVTYTIAHQDVSYSEDNYNRYAIVCWTSANKADSFDENTAPNSATFGNGKYNKVPEVSTQIWVMESIKAVDTNGIKTNQVTLNSLKYANDSSFLMEQKFSFDKRMTEDELNNLTKIHVYRRNATNDKTYLWYASNRKMYESSHFTSDASYGNGTYKIGTPVITNFDATNGTFKVQVSNVLLSDSSTDTESYWMLMCFNDSNAANDPAVQETGNNQFSLVDENNLTDYSYLKLTIYTINDASILSEMFSIPTSTQLLDMGMVK